MRAIVCSAIVLVTGTGCANVANYTSVYRRPDLNDGRSLVLDNEQSAILVIRGDRNGDGCLLYTSDAADDSYACRSRWSPYH